MNDFGEVLLGLNGLPIQSLMEKFPICIMNKHFTTLHADLLGLFFSVYVHFAEGMEGFAYFKKLKAGK